MNPNNCRSKLIGHNKHKNVNIKKDSSKEANSCMKRMKLPSFHVCHAQSLLFPSLFSSGFRQKSGLSLPVRVQKVKYERTDGN